MRHWQSPTQSCFLHTHFTIQIYRGILYPMEALGSRRLSPELYWLRLEYWIWEVSKMTMYEILSLAINVAILILGLLSYLK